MASQGSPSSLFPRMVWKRLNTCCLCTSQSISSKESFLRQDLLQFIFNFPGPLILLWGESIHSTDTPLGPVPTSQSFQSDEGHWCTNSFHPGVLRRSSKVQTPSHTCWWLGSWAHTGVHTLPFSLVTVSWCSFHSRIKRGMSFFPLQYPLSVGILIVSSPPPLQPRLCNNPHMQ